MHNVNKEVYDVVKFDLNAYDEGDDEQTWYCFEPPYYKGWKKVLDMTDECVKEGGSYMVSDSQIN